MKCPRDGVPLVTRHYEDAIDADVCPACRGVWLARGELEAIEESHERDYTEELARMPDLGYNAYELAQQKARTPIRCPQCGGEMESREYARCSQVMIDVCLRCQGVWLDQGEIDALERFFERSRLEAHRLRRGFLAGLRSLFD